MCLLPQLPLASASRDVAVPHPSCSPRLKCRMEFLLPCGPSLLAKGGLPSPSLTWASDSFPARGRRACFQGRVLTALVQSGLTQTEKSPCGPADTCWELADICETVAKFFPIFLGVLSSLFNKTFPSRARFVLILVTWIRAS